MSEIKYNSFDLLNFFESEPIKDEDDHDIFQYNLKDQNNNHLVLKFSVFDLEASLEVHQKHLPNPILRACFTQVNQILVQKDHTLGDYMEIYEMNKEQPSATVYLNPNLQINLL
ncbi:hypothetical protein SAMN04488112_12921 [Melghirimyces thermohalophilus]|uniref:Uncharacterized protein n=1 Tax=Melghirimyces thermohalophilus TaxID=1236220 RepID=A0A1G6RPK3_9BACL|nr:hypothetical protein [Melghirimyces thermohalophilus]SDD05877.1 hypothetical protein SAMN04488112_12921 [Melghirimyces thermohalophilus]